MFVFAIPETGSAPLDRAFRLSDPAMIARVRDACTAREAARAAVRVANRSPRSASTHAHCADAIRAWLPHLSSLASLADDPRSRELRDPRTVFFYAWRFVGMDPAGSAPRGSAAVCSSSGALECALWLHALAAAEWNASVTRLADAAAAEPGGGAPRPPGSLIESIGSSFYFDGPRDDPDRGARIAECFRECASRFQRAAAAFDHAATQLLPKVDLGSIADAAARAGSDAVFGDAAQPVDRDVYARLDSIDARALPASLSAAASRGAALACLAEAQRLVVWRSVSLGNAPGTSASLLAEAARLYADALAPLIAGGSGHGAAGVATPAAPGALASGWIAPMRALNHAAALRFRTEQLLAADSESRGGGAAEAGAQAAGGVGQRGSQGAAVALAKIADATVRAALGSRALLPSAQSALRAEGTRCADLVARAEQNNRMIGMEAVPNHTESTAWFPPPRTVLKPTPFEWPQPLFTSLVQSL